MKTKFEVSTIKSGNDDVIKIRGEMTFDTVTQLLTATSKIFEQKNKLVFDLSGVTRSDSAGLALLIDWLRRTHRAKRQISFLNPPKQLLAIAKVCGVENFLPFDTQTSR